jgi:replication factor C small subunit
MSIQNTLWVEKYRPTTLDDIIGQDDIVKRLKKYATDNEMPNLLLSGRQGTGKTAMVTALAREIYGDNWRNNMLELNASDDRGIDVVREKIKGFARTDTVGEHSFKLIFLDEVDNTTKDAQSAMRRTMEDYSDKTRFVLSCNYANKLLPPIQSRCTTFRVNPLDDEGIEMILSRVALEEGIDVDPEAMDMLVKDASGDARRAINTLQGAHYEGVVKPEDVEVVSPVLDYVEVKEILNLAVSGHLSEAQRRLDVDVLKEGVSGQLFLDVAFSVVKNMDIPEDARAKCIEQIAETDHRLLEGCHPHIQLHNVLSRIHISYDLSLPNYSNE